MSMSQEEIEALMNGLDISDDENDSEETSVSTKVNTQEIEELLSQTEDLKEEAKVENKVEEPSVEASKSDETFEIDDIEELLKNNTSNDLIDNNEIDDLLKEIDSSQLEEEIKENPSDKTKPIEDKVIPTETKESLNHSEDELVKNWTSSKINEGVFPFPADNDTKVVNQLSQVANDSEEKVSQIFDVLSLTLDNNNEIRKNIKEMETFLIAQKSLLSTLNSKFPNISLFNENLEKINGVSNSISGLSGLLNDEDNSIFQAMELMQFNDINRQKIERVMSVIRKLSIYLNNLFEDDGSSKEVAIAKHIHGDENDDLIGDDLDKLIAEFSQKD
jgi:hypothetical protein